MGGCEAAIPLGDTLGYLVGIGNGRLSTRPMVLGLLLLELLIHVESTHHLPGISRFSLVPSVLVPVPVPDFRVRVP